jgi:hypothetical protein
MQQSSFIDVPLARHVSGDFAHHQERGPVLQHVVFCTQFYCVAVRLSRKAAAWSVWVVWRTVLDTQTTQQPSWIAAQKHNKTGCRTAHVVIQIYAPDDGRDRPKHVELMEHQ